MFLISVPFWKRVGRSKKPIFLVLFFVEIKLQICYLASIFNDQFTVTSMLVFQSHFFELPSKSSKPLLYRAGWEPRKASTGHKEKQSLNNGNDKNNAICCDIVSHSGIVRPLGHTIRMWALANEDT